LVLLRLLLELLLLLPAAAAAAVASFVACSCPLANSLISHPWGFPSVFFVWPI
jgi:hypothetical protein